MHNPLDNELAPRALVRSGELELTLGERVVAVEPRIRAGEVVACQRNLPMMIAQTKPSSNGESPTHSPIHGNFSGPQ